MTVINGRQQDCLRHPLEKKTFYQRLSDTYAVKAFVPFAK